MPFILEYMIIVCVACYGLGRDSVTSDSHCGNKRLILQKQYKTEQKSSSQLNF